MQYDPEQRLAIDLTTPKQIHVVGVGGAGMSAIAGVLLAMGHKVSGSDTQSSPAIDRLARAGADVWLGHHPERIPSNVDAVVPSNAIPRQDPDLVAATERSIPVLRRTQVLTAIASVRRTIGVAGTHGKTTTSTLLAHVLQAGGLEPSWLIGGEIIGRGNGAHWGSGELLVVEADESDGAFLELGADSIIVTSTDPDHLENYGSLDDRESAIRNFRTAFAVFTASAPGERVLCADDPGCVEMANLFDATTYGQAPIADYRIVALELDRFEARFRVEHQGERSGVVRLPVPGIHNVLNATGALALAHRFGVSIEVGTLGIAEFKGVGRRFQFRGERNAITFVDDYAHLPAEVRAATAAAKGGDWQRVVVVFQPHRYSRTEQVGADFEGAFDAADLLVLTDVFSAGESARPGIDGTVIKRAVESREKHPPIHYIEDRTMLAKALVEILRPGDLCLTLGAGDITRLFDEILDELS